MSDNNHLEPALLNFAGKILSKREIHSCNASLKHESINFVEEIKNFLFPHFSSRLYYSNNDVLAKMQLLERNLITLLRMLNGKNTQPIVKIAKDFVYLIPAVHDMLWDDAQSIYDGDPAAESIDEIILAYPGFMAIFIFRIAHELYKFKVPIIPRILTEYAHEKTGIDIHPGATIGSPFFIDHGTGIVIGETTLIGKNVKIYQGVTLGALSVDKTMNKAKRHPTIEDNVIIYAQAVILGGNTTIGSKSVIGGNAWITQSVPPGSLVYSKSEVRIRSAETYFDTLEYII